MLAVILSTILIWLAIGFVTTFLSIRFEKEEIDKRELYIAALSPLFGPARLICFLIDFPCMYIHAPYVLKEKSQNEKED
tara:strand:+ start:366 stop:602 length:237 start_codon:yes stop_codon:yes gene_type:complete